MGKPIGALWIQTGEKGEFWSGNIELPDGTKQNVIVFRNSYKKDKQPDFKIYIKKKKEENYVPNDEVVFQPEQLNNEELPF